MRNYYRIPLVFLFLAAVIGLFLRWQFIVPTDGVRYTYFLHGHSHVMFLGWIFNVLYLAFISHHCPAQVRRLLLRCFLVLQALVVAMMISFPIQGYGVFSIIFSTLHTLAAVAFIPFYFYLTRKDLRISAWFSRIAWIFFFISTAGPFGLGFLMANDMGTSVWYNLSIYYYLHFQYNGFFLFGAFSLFYQMLEKKQVAFSISAARSFGLLMAGACVPAYALSTLFSQPGLLFNVIGGIAGLIQIVAVGLLIRELLRLLPILKKKFSSTTRNMWLLILLSLVAKSLLQLLSSHPDIAIMAYELRPIVIAYLHLVLVGIITFFLVTWYFEMALLKRRIARYAIGSFVIGFLGSQVCLVISPWWSNIISDALPATTAIFWFSAFMVVGTLLLALSFIPEQVQSPGNLAHQPSAWKTDKSHKSA